MNIMKAAINYATKVIAVSPGYAWELGTDEGGWGLAPTRALRPRQGERYC